MVILASLLVGCGRPENEGSTREAGPPIAGRPIQTGARTNLAGVGAVQPGTNAVSTPGRPTDVVSEAHSGSGQLALSFEVLAGYPYRVYEYYAEGVAGRPLLKSDDSIPDSIRRLDGRAVAIQGFVLPLRTRKGKVTEFLLLKDQGTCCFGPQAQINHFVRVNFPGGRTFESGQPYRASGRLRVGETYVQGYLTGLYQLEAESVDGP